MAETLYAPSLNGHVDIDPATLFTALGTTGLRHAGGFITEELLPELQGARGLRILRQMRDNGAIVGAILFAIEMLIRNTIWTMKPADASNAAQAEADWLKAALYDDMDQTWPEVLTEILSMLWAGFAPHELVYKRRMGQRPPPSTDLATWHPSRFDDGLIGWAGWPIRAQETILRWQIGPHGEIEALEQLDPYSGRAIPPIPWEKFLLFRPTATKGNPEGRSILRNAYESWHYSKSLSRVQAYVIERGLGGFPVLYVPPNLMSIHANVDEKAVLAASEDLVKNIRQDKQSGAVLPAIFNEQGQRLCELQLLTPTRPARHDIDDVIRRYDLNIALSVIADVLFVGHEGSGGYGSLMESKSELFGLGIQSYLHTIAAVINRYAFPRLWALNGKRPALQPTFEPGEIQTIDLKEIGQYIKDLTGAGFDLTDMGNHLRAIAGMPQRTEPLLTPEGAIL